MEVVESYISSKTGILEDCEDAIYFDENFACVIDGATSKSSQNLPNNKTAGTWAASILLSAVKDLDIAANLEQFISTGTQRIAEFYQLHNMYEQAAKNPINRLTASIVIFSKFYSQIWMVGDCQCLVEHEKYTNSKIIDLVLSEARSVFLSSELMLGKTIDNLIEFDTGRDFIMPLLERQSLFQNSTYSTQYTYGVFDGFPIGLRNVRVIDVSKDVNYLVLASDGYPELAFTLSESEKRLREILNRDPLCFLENKSTKGITGKNVSYDDRAYLKIKL